MIVTHQAIYHEVGFISRLKKTVNFLSSINIIHTNCSIFLEIFYDAQKRKKSIRRVKHDIYKGSNVYELKIDQCSGTRNSNYKLECFTRPT